MRYAREAGLPATLEAVNATGYGLTQGVHTRIDETVAQASCRRTPATSTSTATSSARWWACSRSAAKGCPARA
ncbi:MAG: hypothetical protein U1F25_05395 [Rubrivivax sp.]